MSDVKNYGLGGIANFWIVSQISRNRILCKCSFGTRVG